MDCSEIACDLFEAAGRTGSILRVEAGGASRLAIREAGDLQRVIYHEVYTDGNYVFDPRLSPYPVSLKTWRGQILGDNPDAKVIGGSRG